MAAPRPTFNLGSFLEKDKLKIDGTNFTNWFRTLRILLVPLKMAYILEGALGDAPADDASKDEKNVCLSRTDDYNLVQSGMLYSMEAELQKRFERMGAYEIITDLKAVFAPQARAERYEASEAFFSAKMDEHGSVSEHVVKMSGYVQRLNALECQIPDELAVDRVLQSLPPSYKGFVLNYNMQGMTKTPSELFAMLKSAEVEIKKEHAVFMVNKTTDFKKSSRREKARRGGPKRDGKSVAAPPKAPKPKLGVECFYCKGEGHWKRNCPKYLKDKKAGKVAKRDEGIFDIHIVDLLLTSAGNTSWIFDTGSVAHISNSIQGLRNRRRLVKDEVTMRVGNGCQIEVLEVGTKHLSLPSGLVLVLNNCYYVPALSVNIISGSCLKRDRYSFKSDTIGCSIYKDEMFYVHAPELHGLFVLDLDADVCHINNLEAKRLKSDEEHMMMWHCRLGHIGIKRMEKLHKDGLLDSLDFGSLDTCEPCLMGKMTRTPFNGIMERADVLLGIIHTDVCGPMNVPTRNGLRYFVNFTDDLSIYGYIYLMKHKSETFEKFKEFQNEVENQLGKKIKHLRSDRGGEYLSHEFGNHLKSCGIVPQLTPAGTPQRNGVAERLNRTLLDSVRSMMSHTDLPVSFWGYALETAAQILNRAPSKSVKTTQFEEVPWHET